MDELDESPEKAKQKNLFRPFRAIRNLLYSQGSRARFARSSTLGFAVPRFQRL
jgi:hypothetical protein